jgi:Tol biopolymer transport system component
MKHWKWVFQTLLIGSLVAGCAGSAGQAGRGAATATPPPGTPPVRSPTSLVPSLPTSTPGEPVVPQPIPTAIPLPPQTGSGYRAENIHILNERQLTRDGQFIFFPVSWSPDGIKLAASRQTGKFVEASEGMYPITEIWILNADGSSEHAVTEGHLPSWSGDGTMLAFSHFVFENNQAKRLQLRTIDLSTQKINTLKEDDTGYQQFDWLASGHRGMLVQDQGIIEVDGDGSNPRPLAIEDALKKTVGLPISGDVFFKPAPSGRWMILGKNQNLWLLDLVANPVDVKAQLSSDLEGSAGEPTWSPVGHYLAFSEFDGSLHIVKPDTSDGGHTVRPPSGGGKPHWLSWSPDEQLLMFALDGNLYVVNADGSGLRQLTTSGQYDFPVWSPSGTQVAFEKFDHNVWVLDIDNRRPGIDNEGTK